MAEITPYELSTGQSRTIQVKLDALEIYQGRYWYSDNIFQDVPAGETVYIQIKTGNELFYLRRMDVSVSDGPWNVKIRENPDITDGTNELSQFNINRSVDDSDGITIYDNPTNVSGGTVIRNIELYDPGTGAKTGLLSNAILNWIFKANSDYVLELTNDNGSVQNVSIAMEYKEEQDVS